MVHMSYTYSMSSGLDLYYFTVVQYYNSAPRYFVMLQSAENSSNLMMKVFLRVSLFPSGIIRPQYRTKAYYTRSSVSSSCCRLVQFRAAARSLLHGAHLGVALLASTRSALSSEDAAAAAAAVASISDGPERQLINCFRFLETKCGTIIEDYHIPA